MPTLPPKQLAMVNDQESIRNLPEVSLPLGYVLRGYRIGDETSWGRDVASVRIRELERS